jgi:L-alanine-DL-glutamate epimerase-like enolase superfamily enzyme
MDVQAHAEGIRRLVHEFNNLLLVIGGHCELVSAQCAELPQAKADLDVVADAVSRATGLTAELRVMAIAATSDVPRTPHSGTSHDVVAG